MLDLLIEDIKQVWSPERFNISHRPHVVGTIPSDLILSPKEDVLDMPIKLPHGEFMIPLERNVQEIVGLCADFEKQINPAWQEYHCYLTLNQGRVHTGKTQRNAGVHFDGMQGVNYPAKLRACHQYLVSSALPTTFYAQPFNPSLLDQDRHNWFKAFETQARDDTSFSPNPFDIVLTTAYCLHAATTAKRLTERTFVRVEFSLKQFNRMGNSINPHLETGWTYEDKPIPKHLI